MLLQCLAALDCFFTETIVALGKWSICPKVKLLIALNVIAYVCSSSAFQDYFQMGLSTAHDFVRKFCYNVSHNIDLRSIYLWPINCSDAMKVSELHESTHGIAEMVGSIDCMHVGWKNCPVAQQGHEQGKEDYPTTVLELLLTTVCGFGMRHLDRLDHSMILIFGKGAHF